MVTTSAKSKLMKPGCVIASVIPLTAFNKTSFAALKALTIEIFAPKFFNNLSLSITIKESTCFDNSVIPDSALTMCLLPSNLNGRVTTATVSAPVSLAISAIIGAAPVPVPPPIPAVINTISEPWINFLISSLLSSAALRPLFGSQPAPKPLVNLTPI